ncbi:MAG: GAF domain-containing sensor histidine kinase [Candidatus Dormibacteria bacterium]
MSPRKVRAGPAGAAAVGEPAIRADPDPVTAEVALLALAGGGREELHHQILGALAAGSGADVVALLALGPSDRGISVVAQIGLSPLPEGLVPTEADLKLVDAKATVLRPSAGPRAGAIAALLHQKGQRAAIAAGLAPHGIGQLLVAARARGPFATDARTAVAGVAGVLAAVERRHWSSELADRRLREQAAVAALGRGALVGGEDLVELAQASCAAAAANLTADIVAVLERGPDGAVPTAGIGCPAEALSQELAWVEALCSRVAHSGEPLVIPDIREEPDLTRGAHDPPTARSVLIVPIRTGLRVAGFLLATSRQPAAYSEEDVTFVRGLANVVALADDRTRVQAQLRLSVDELRKSADDRRRLLVHVVQAQEEERRRIADDIHDDSVQVMTAVALRLATLRRRLGGGALDPLLLNLEHDVRQSITRLRHLMFVLRPPALEAHGIAAALHAFLAEVAEDAGLAYTLDDRLRREPEPEARTVVYRIAQEAVSNICKHARAGRIEVVLSEQDGSVLVEIRDDGIGFDPTSLPQTPPGHLGLLVMRERAEQSGGWCVVESEPGVGTAVRYCVGSQLLSGQEAPPAGAGDSVPVRSEVS